MKIISLVENTTKSDMKARHGLSLYIETKRHRLLFDLGPDRTLFENAAKRNIDLSKVDTVILSHGHKDHGGALKAFLEINSTAEVYVQRAAFEPHYAKTLFFRTPIGIDGSLKENRQIRLINGDCRIDEELLLFTVKQTEKCRSSANRVLYDQNGRDTFSHEQNLVISENRTALIMGCGHTGIVNIMEKAKRYHPELCIGGFHLYDPIMKKTVPESLLDEIAKELSKEKNIRFYTCHCTGKEAFRYLSGKMQNLSYMACGDVIEI